MIHPELVRVRKRNGRLTLQAPTVEREHRALALSEALLEALSPLVGEPRSVVEETLSALECSPQEKKLSSALKKLALDDCVFDSKPTLDAQTLREAVFCRAAVARMNLPLGARFERGAILAEVAEDLKIGVEELEGGLYADLRSAERLQAAPRYDARDLLVRHARAELQAVLLCSVRVVLHVRCASPDQYRELFHKLKFRQLLFQIQPEASGGYRIEIDGPYSLFESVTKYGLELALLLPALEACDSVHLTADLRWGKRREALQFAVELGNGSGLEPAAARDDVGALQRAFAEDSQWGAAPAREVLNLPGIGLCVPDLCFTHRPTGERVLCEVLGFWNRDAVWRRIELVERGLESKILFVVSARLRVSEDMLDGSSSAALYVYKGAINPKAVERKLDRLRRREVLTTTALGSG